ncbi:HAMP domain-containing sensor histidine kinase [Sorangium sp. So ce1036]|uniref:sensor histidine kinase n=1 Tax=Sorangium sp. So ce1036 TaxID=3133328 RepID=UPI003F1012F2
MRPDAHKGTPAGCGLDDEDLLGVPGSAPVPSARTADASGASKRDGPQGAPEPATLPPPAAAPVVDLVGIGPLSLEDLVDRGALGEMAASFHRLFGLPIRIQSTSGVTLAESGALAPSGGPVGEEQHVRRPGAAPADRAARRGAPVGDELTDPRFSGALYQVFPIEYDGRTIGRSILGPYLPEDGEGAPAAPVEAAAQPDPARAAEPAPRLARLRPERLGEIADHLRAVLDLILFSGHKSLLTSTMHVASIRESFRELSQKNAELEQAYERLKELDRLKSNFLATVSHELRTPLTSIMGYSEMLAEGIGGSLNDEQREFIETIRSKSEQLLGLIMSLLDLSKLESGTLIVRRAEVAVAPMLHEAASTIAPAATKKGVDLRIDAEDDLPPVLGDGDRLRQVFINLVENAVKFTEAGGEVQLVARAVSDEGDDLPGLVLVAPLQQAVEIRVVDTGIGIAPSERSKVFDPFYQVDQSSTREHGGTGLGLSIVKRLVEAHGGTVRIETNEPRGTVFVVKLPTAAGAPANSVGAPPVFQ